MPELSRFFGIIIAMKYNDHAPPHFHANYGSDEAVFHIDKETLENPAHLRENEPVTAGQDWVDGRQAAWLLGLRAHHSQEADQTGEVSL
jgi:hypothetical protein